MSNPLFPNPLFLSDTARCSSDNGPPPAGKIRLRSLLRVKVQMNRRSGGENTTRPPSPTRPAAIADTATYADQKLLRLFHQGCKPSGDKGDFVCIGHREQRRPVGALWEYYGQLPRPISSRYLPKSKVYREIPGLGCYPSGIIPR